MSQTDQPSEALGVGSPIVAAWTRRMRATQTDRAAAEAATRAFYAEQNLPQPQRVEWLNDPGEAWRLSELIPCPEYACIGLRRSDMELADILEQHSVPADIEDRGRRVADQVCWFFKPHSGRSRDSLLSLTGMDGGALARLDHLRRQGHLPGKHPMALALDVLAEVFLFLPHRHIALLVPKPDEFSADANGRLHSLTGPAVRFGSRAAYFFQGLRVEEPLWSLLSQGLLPPAREIITQPNTELRRLLMQRYGHAHLVEDLCGRATHQDDFGTLYHLEIPADEPLVMVKVVNSTPEPDGTFKDYFLRVPPGMKTAREAVAWTFRLEPYEYEPIQET